MEQFCLPGDVWQCLEIFLAVTSGVGDATVIQRVEARSTANAPMHKNAPTTKNHLAPNVSSARLATLPYSGSEESP